MAWNGSESLAQKTIRTGLPRSCSMLTNPPSTGFPAQCEGISLQFQATQNGSRLGRLGALCEILPQEGEAAHRFGVHVIQLARLPGRREELHGPRILGKPGGKQPGLNGEFLDQPRFGSRKLSVGVGQARHRKSGVRRGHGGRIPVVQGLCVVVQGLGVFLAAVRRQLKPRLARNWTALLKMASWPPCLCAFWR